METEKLLSTIHANRCSKPMIDRKVYHDVEVNLLEVKFDVTLQKVYLREIIWVSKTIFCLFFLSIQ